MGWSRGTVRHEWADTSTPADNARGALLKRPDPQPAVPTIWYLLPLSLLIIQAAAVLNGGLSYAGVGLVARPTHESGADNRPDEPRRPSSEGARVRLASTKHRTINQPGA